MRKIGEYQTVISETLLDAFGHVNNANYLRLFEEARWALINSRGYGMKEIKELGQSPIILQVNLQFRRELTARDEIKITTECKAYRGKIGILEQLMLRGEELCAHAEFKFGLFDLKIRKLIEPTEKWKQAIGWE